METRLRNWTPRRPSAKLKERLFPPAEPAASESTSPRWEWLAPVSAAFLLSIMALTTSNPDLSKSRYTTSPGARKTLRSANWTNYAADINVLTAVLEWTNSGHSHSSLGSLFLYNTNGLKY